MTNPCFNPLSGTNKVNKLSVDLAERLLIKVYL